MPNTIFNQKIFESINFLPNQDIFLNEAIYGFRYISPYIEALPSNASVLEVGSGPCVLLSHLSDMFKSISFTGIEPIGPGFDKFKTSLDQLRTQFQFDLYEGTYESFGESRTEKYDLIFLINVFEHLQDWSHFIKFVKFHLKNRGKCVILCPNYSLPYESHFQIPIIINKTFTYKIFRKHIENYEIMHSQSGLWSSLNFVKLRKVQRVVDQQSLELKRNDRITIELINRLSYDQEFKKRQNVVGKIAKVANMFGVLNLFQFYPFYLFQPYIFLELTHRPSAPRP